MTRHKRTEITIETERVLIIGRRHSTQAWCPECGRNVYVVQAQMLTGGAQPRLLKGDDAGPQSWHSFEGPDGKALVCLESLLKAM
ncbi:MAG: hypothetical protein WBV46_11900 [Terriglobales bacterium]|jgi:hypothetical protein